MGAVRLRRSLSFVDPLHVQQCYQHVCSSDPSLLQGKPAQSDRGAKAYADLSALERAKLEPAHHHCLIQDIMSHAVATLSHTRHTFVISALRKETHWQPRRTAGR